MNDPRNRFGYYANLYNIIWNNYIDKGIDHTIDPNDKENRYDTEYDKKHYLDVGYDAMRIVLQALMTKGCAVPSRILDFPCGSGRVTRHFAAMFPKAHIGACDLYEGHIAFCDKQFNAQPILSSENLDTLDIGEWDLIFCGSLLTHLPENQFLSAIRFLIRSLSSDGIAIVTLEGRHALYIQDHKWKFIEDDLFRIARENFNSKGFGFVDYGHQFMAETFSKQDSYGVALTSGEWLMRGLTAIEEIRVISFAERDWDDHQDVVVFGKPGVNL